MSSHACAGSIEVTSTIPSKACRAQNFAALSKPAAVSWCFGAVLAAAPLAIALVDHHLRRGVVPKATHEVWRPSRATFFVDDALHAVLCVLGAKLCPCAPRDAERRPGCATTGVSTTATRAALLSA